MKLLENKYILGIIAVLFIILIISSIDVVHHPSSVNNTPRHTNIQHQEIAKEVALSPKPTKHITPQEYLQRQIREHGLPETDQYMAESLRLQLKDLNNRFYYDNCRYEPL